ncbi:B- and T-lymphocyte attenuator-like isoform X1 [Lepisosteus oculatus]|uniref:B- and T-lymphocyte attenuator-like isoform X1 n=1 Tax=Lepisosteus oculatus TaxID=7918 RepID=UPI0035F51758
MFPPQRRLILELLLLLSVSSQVQGKENECALEVLVPRNSVLNSPALRRLTINCGLKYCEEKPAVRWCKLHEKTCNPVNKTDIITTEWKEKDPNSATYSLTFSKITFGDSGQYRCEAAANVSSVYQSTVSHSILVSVSEAVKTVNISENNTTGEEIPQQGNPDWLTYIYICAGVVAFIIIVMFISFLCIQGQKSAPQSAAPVQTKQHIAPKPSGQGSAPPGLPDRPRSVRSQTAGPASETNTTYDNDGVRRKSRSKRTAPNGVSPTKQKVPSHVAVMVDHSDVYDNVERGEEEVYPIVYAALNHNSDKIAARSSEPLEDTEYAAIRV